MLVKRYITSMLNVDYVELPAGEEIFTSTAEEAARIYGAYIISGGFEISSAEEPQIVGKLFLPEDGLKAVEAAKPFTVKPRGDSTWFCTSQNDDVRRNVSTLAVSGTATLPANHGFFVLEGTVEADGKTANRLQFFKPRPAALTVQGNGILLLVE